MFSFLTKALLFLTSYIPLYAIVGIYNYRKPVVWITMVVASILLLILAKIAIGLPRKVNYDALLTIKLVKDVTGNNLVSYLFTYFLSMARWNFESVEGVTALILAFAFIGYMFIRFNLIFINPILNIILNLNVYSIEAAIKGSDVFEDHILISRRSVIELNRLNTLPVHQIASGILLDSDSLKKN